MLVAIGVASLMFILINQVFNSTQRAVSQGVSLNDIMAAARSVGDQITLDGNAMIGPQDAKAGADGGGILMIVQHRFNNVDVREGPRGLTTTRDIRSDQLVFIRERGEQYPLTPSAPKSFTPADVGSNSQFMRVWYGHVSRTNEDGSDQGTAVLMGQGRDKLGTDWILGRQGMFLNETLDKPVRWAHANGGWYSAPTVGHGASTPSWASAYTSSQPPIYMAISDYAYFSLNEPTIGSHGSMVGPDATGTNGSLRLAASLTENDYIDRAVQQYSFATQRLRCNPIPEATSTTNYDAWQIAQMHPYLVEHCTDFIVEFAADVNNDGDIDLNADDSIRWYTGDAYDDNTATPPTYFPGGTYGPYEDVSSVASVQDNATEVFVWRHDADTNTTTATPWPYLIRIRYRLHDQRGAIRSGDDQHGVWFEHIIRVNRP